MPARRGRLVGTDLLPAFAAAAPLDVFGMDTDQLPVWVTARTTCRRPRCTPRWHAAGCTCTRSAGRHSASRWSRRCTWACRWSRGHHGGGRGGAAGGRRLFDAVDVLAGAVRHYLADPDAAAEAGRVARQAALARYGLERFLDDWDRLLKEVTR